MTAGPATTILVDGHTHLHDAFDPVRFVETVDDNLRRGRPDASDVTCALVASTDARPALEGLRARLAGGLPGGGSVLPTEEDASLVVARGGRPRTVLVAGRQLRTAERLELLLWGCGDGDGARFDGAGFAATLDAALASAPLVIVPWAFGKWALGRYSRIRDAFAALSDEDRSRLLLGDNANRPPWRLPRPLARLRDEGFAVLPGSDPFPFEDEVHRVGTFGLALECALDLERPAASIGEALRRDAARGRTIGGPLGMTGFVRNQVRIRLRRGEAAR
ncbi:MAG: hypothetical protein R3195_10090 [Gemmatimonadota bacterium]|nr:hypothetical protein [Gemmatimonadota bacterium]